MRHSGPGQTLRPEDVRRCQAMETRLTTDRGYRKHLFSVQCSLPRHVDSVQHSWKGRAFGSAGKRWVPSRQPRRCANREVREIGHRKYGGQVRLQEVRCSLPAGHSDPCSWMGRTFGTAPAKRTSGKSGRRRRQLAAEAS